MTPFSQAFETSKGLAAHPYSLNCSTVSVTVLGESKNLLVSKISNLFLISLSLMNLGSLNSGSNASASSRYSKPNCTGSDSEFVVYWFHKQFGFHFQVSDSKDFQLLH